MIRVCIATMDAAAYRAFRSSDRTIRSDNPPAHQQDTLAGHIPKSSHYLQFAAFPCRSIPDCRGEAAASFAGHSTRRTRNGAATSLLSALLQTVPSVPPFGKGIPSVSDQTPGQTSEEV